MPKPTWLNDSRHTCRGLAKRKRCLANLLSAPGKLTVRDKSVAIRLAPAGTARERDAFVRFLRHVNRLKLQLPGNDVGRTLHFSLLKRSHD
jgi:hypothetical protein